jgi:hypothetical protein
MNHHPPSFLLNDQVAEIKKATLTVELPDRTVTFEVNNPRIVSAEFGGDREMTWDRLLHELTAVPETPRHIWSVHIEAQPLGNPVVIRLTESPSEPAAQP